MRVAILGATILNSVTEADGVEFDAVYTGEIWRNVSGGIEEGVRYLDNLDLMLEIDIAEAWGFGAGTLFMYGLYNNDTTLSDELVGDLQVVSNIDATEAWRVYEFWYEYSAERWSLRSGLYDLNSEFDSKETGALFINSSHGIGPDFSQSGQNGPGIFPVSSLAVRAEVEVGQVAARFAVLDGVPGNPDNPASNSIDLSRGEGFLTVAEMDLPMMTTGRLWAGYWRFTADHESLIDRVAQAGNDGWYVGFEQQFRLGTRSAAWYARYGKADAHFNPVGDSVGAALVIDAPLRARPDDTLGFAVASARVGDAYKRLANLAGAGARDAETVWELTYQAVINDHLSLQPDIQFIDNPSATRELDDAWVVGLRFQLAY